MNRETKLKPIEKVECRNASLFKYKNTRVTVFSMPNNEYTIELKLLSDDISPRALHRVKRNKIVFTGIKISAEAAISIMVGLQSQLRKDGII